MIWSTIALKDATIYENDPYRNSGLDQILEIGKTGSYSDSTLCEYRTLIKFDLSELSTILTDNNISINDITASLNLTSAQEYEIPKSYIIEGRSVSAEWENGSGYVGDPIGTISSLEITDGVTWDTLAGYGSTNWSASLDAGSTWSYNTVSGGGTWNTGSVVSQSFNFKSDASLNLDVTNFVRDWENGVIINNGIILSLRQNDITGSNCPDTKLQFFSAETHTVFEPQLYISWASSSYQTGSAELMSYTDNPIIYTKYFKAEYLKDTKVRINLGARPKYPRRQFAQNSVFSDGKLLPENSYYQIRDAHNDRIIIPYSECTKLNTNSSGSYFEFYTTMLYSERFYRFEIKAVFDEITEYFNSNDFVFKIRNNNNIY